MSLRRIVCWLFWHRLTVPFGEWGKPPPWDLRCERCGKRVMVDRGEARNEP
jgi:hypothetical protein